MLRLLGGLAHAGLGGVDGLTGTVLGLGGGLGRGVLCASGCLADLVACLLEGVGGSVVRLQGIQRSGKSGRAVAGMQRGQATMQCRQLN